MRLALIIDTNQCFLICQNLKNKEITWIINCNLNYEHTYSLDLNVGMYGLEACVVQELYLCCGPWWPLLSLLPTDSALVGDALVENNI
jgi:hypothetical protein